MRRETFIGSKFTYLNSMVVVYEVTLTQLYKEKYCICVRSRNDAWTEAKPDSVSSVPQLGATWGWGPLGVLLLLTVLIVPKCELYYYIIIVILQPGW